MPRNFVRRVEVMFPIDDSAIRDRVLGEILATQLADNVKARVLLPDGSYQRAGVGPEGVAVRSQEAFVALARRRSEAVAAPRPQDDIHSGGVLLTLSKPADAAGRTRPATAGAPILAS
jgi:hypothetical protein